MTSWPVIWSASDVIIQEESSVLSTNPAADSAVSLENSWNGRNLRTTGYWGSVGVGAGGGGGDKECL